MKQRMTIQKKMVLDAVRSLTCHPTAGQVYLCVKSAHPTISKATVYRNLSQLADNGEILKIEVPNGADHFDFEQKGITIWSAKSAIRCLTYTWTMIKSSTIAQENGQDVKYTGTTYSFTEFVRLAGTWTRLG